MSNYISSAPTALFAIPSPTTSHSTPLQAAIEIDEQYELEYVIERMESERNQQIMASLVTPVATAKESRSEARQGKTGRGKGKAGFALILLCCAIGSSSYFGRRSRSTSVHVRICDYDEGQRRQDPGCFESLYARPREGINEAAAKAAQQVAQFEAKNTEQGESYHQRRGTMASMDIGCQRGNPDAKAAARGESRQAATRATGPARRRAGPQATTREGRGRVHGRGRYQGRRSGALLCAVAGRQSQDTFYASCEPDGHRGGDAEQVQGYAGQAPSRLSCKNDAGERRTGTTVSAPFAARAGTKSASSRRRGGDCQGDAWSWSIHTRSPIRCRRIWEGQIEVENQIRGVTVPCPQHGSEELGEKATAEPWEDAWWMTPLRHKSHTRRHQIQSNEVCLEDGGVIKFDQTFIDVDGNSHDEDHAVADSTVEFTAHSLSTGMRWRLFGWLVVGDISVFILTFLLLLWNQARREKQFVRIGRQRFSKSIRRPPQKKQARKVVLWLLYLQGIHPGLGEVLRNAEAGQSVLRGSGAPGNAEEAPWDSLIPLMWQDFPSNLEEQDVVSFMGAGTTENCDPTVGVGEPTPIANMLEAVQQDSDVEIDEEHSDSGQEDESEASHPSMDEEVVSQSAQSEHRDDPRDEDGPVVEEQEQAAPDREMRTDEALDFHEDPGPYSTLEGIFEVDWNHFYQFRRNHYQRHCFLRWNYYNNLVRSAANTWDVSRHEILDLIDMQVHVSGVPVTAQKAIVVVNGDDVPFDLRPHVLMDVVWHNSWYFAEGPMLNRKVMRIQSPLTRQEVLVAAEVAGHCRNQRQRCIVRKDGQIQPEQMTTPMTVGDGTYIQIDVPPMEDICDGATNLLQTKVKMVSRLRRQTDTLKLLYELERSSVQPTDIAAFFRVGCDNNVVCYLCRANWTHHTFDDLPPPGNTVTEFFDLTADDEATSSAIPSVQLQLSPPDDIHVILNALKPWEGTVLQHDFSPECELLPISLQYLSGCVEGSPHDASELYLYTDGSYSASDNTSSFAVAIFGWNPRSEANKHMFIGWFASNTITDPDHAQYTGAEQHSAEDAEVSAILWAVIWILQSGLRIPCHICFDSMIAGYSASGRWNVRTGWQHGEHLRSIVQYSEALRQGCIIDFQHVKAHSLQPGNELVDALSRFRNSHKEVLASSGLPSWQPLFRAECNVLQWAWWFFKSWAEDTYPRWRDGQQTWTYFDNRGMEGVPNLEDASLSSSPSTKTYTLNMATFNVLTLRNRTEDPDLEVGMAAAHVLRQQLHQGGYHIVGLQETRANNVCTLRSENYFRYISGNLDGSGTGGVELWISRLLPFASDGEQSFNFQDANVTILQAAKDLLGATIRCGGHQLLVIVCHAPHDGSHEDVKEEWWSRLSAFVDQHHRKGRLIILGDFNARLGYSMEPYIGDRLCSVTTNNGERFQDFVGRHGIWLPSTNSNYHTTGDHTWTHPKGQGARLDYIGLDITATWSVIWSGTDDNVQIPHSAMDHTLVGLSITWCDEKAIQRQLKRNYDWKAMATIEGREKLQTMLASIPQLPWDCEVHRHWQYLDECIHTGLHQLFPVQQRPKRSDIFSQQTWHGLQRKQVLREHFSLLDAFQDELWLEAALTTWKFGVALRGGLRKELLYFIVHELARMTLVQVFRSNSKTLRNRVATDKAHYIEGIIKEADQASNSEIFASLNRLRVGAKFRKIQNQPLPQLIKADGQMAANETEKDKVWFDQCAKLEAGIATTTGRLLQRLRKGSFARASQHTHRRLQEAPTLLSLERSFRRIQKGKAAGQDELKSDLYNLAPTPLAQLYFPLLAKMVFQFSEPIQSKGGIMISAFKGGQQNQIESYRGLLLSSHAGKALRRSIRQQLQEYYTASAQPFHFSVKMGGNVAHAAHALRAYHSMARRQGHSTGTLFLDIRSAYYRVIRQLAATLSNSDEDICRVLQVFDLAPEHLDDLPKELHGASACSDSGVPDVLETMLAEMLSGTWFLTRTKNELCESLAGSRPGDGLADLVFGYVFKRVMQRVVSAATQEFDWSIPAVQMEIDVEQPSRTQAEAPPFVEVSGQTTSPYAWLMKTQVAWLNGFADAQNWFFKVSELMPCAQTSRKARQRSFFRCEARIVGNSKASFLESKIPTYNWKSIRRTFHR